MEEKMIKPQIGSNLPEFALEAFTENQIKKITNKDLEGKWSIIFFYPADFTFVCPTELGDMADLYEEFKKEDAEVYSVSTDTAFVHKAWYDNSETIGRIKFPMLADPTGFLCKALGTYIPEEGLSLRGTYIVDPDGVIKAFEINDNNIGRNAKETLRKLQAAKFVREHGGEVCPANWKPGGNTLKPGLDLVGKI
jgi:NADH-dependent peroxiredoxin subunit C